MAETKQDQRDGFLFYRSYYEAAKCLPASVQAAFLMAICAYVFDGTEPKLKGTSKSAWILTKPNLDANSKRRRKRKTLEETVTESMPSESDHWSTNGQPLVSSESKPMVDTDKGQRDKGQEIKDKKDEGQETEDKGQENGAAAAGEAAEEKKTVCSSGLLSEIKAFVLSCGGSEAQGQAFFDQYEKAGWMAGGRPVENWQGLCRNWLRCGGGEGKNPASAPPACSVPTADSAGYRVPPSARRNARQLLRLLEEDAG